MARGSFARLMIAIAFVSLAALALAMPVHAQQQPAAPGGAGGGGEGNEAGWNKFMRSLGISSNPDAASDINYTERAPLVIPPSRDLPPPAVDPARPAADWPSDTKKEGKRQKPKDAVVPDTAVATPNPPKVKKPWYDPSGWFDKEEYANFRGEPVRQDLTDPPAGYRVPSPDQPYGINPNDKKRPPAAPGNPPPGGGQPPGAQPAAAPPAAAPQASSQPTGAPQAADPQPAGSQPANAQPTR